MPDPVAAPGARWARDAIFYHLYPLGCLGAPACNEGGPPIDRLAALHGWLDHLQELGVTALYLGPLFESSRHGYDTRDYFHVDRRLGDDHSLADFSAALHARGMRLVLDAVFNHTGREFWAFEEVRKQGLGAPHAGWYLLDGKGRSPLGDPFAYRTWAGHAELVQLNLDQAQVREHLFAAVSSWIERFDIDGLRLDAADVLAPEFRLALATHCRAAKPDFWLMGEVVHGDYRQWAFPGGLDSTTNYELYKGLWSAHNDRNYFEIAHTLDRQFGPEGRYRGLALYNFADNHDVDRVASTLRDPAWLQTLYLLLFTIPGVPSIYYGSEFGLRGRKTRGSDAPLRPAATVDGLRRQAPQPGLPDAIRRLAALRRAQPALRHGDYRTLHVAPQQLAFRRGEGHDGLVVAVNAAAQPVQLRVPVPACARMVDLLDAGQSFAVTGGVCALALPACGGRVLASQAA
jgi:glycosidase